MDNPNKGTKQMLKDLNEDIQPKLLNEVELQSGIKLVMSDKKEVRDKTPEYQALRAQAATNFIMDFNNMAFMEDIIEPLKDDFVVNKANWYFNNSNK